MKKKIALNLLGGIQKIAAKNMDIIRLDKTAGLFRFTDIDQESDFHFSVVDKVSEDSYHVTRKPSGEHSVGAFDANLKTDQLIGHFSAWVEIVRKYTELETVFDDPILKKHQEYFFNEFEMVDADADIAPFEIPKQLILAAYLEKIQDFILDNKGSFKDQDEPELLIQECENIIEELPSTSKNEVLKQISSISARIVKNGMGMLKKHISNFGGEFTKKIGQLSAESLVNFLKNHSDDITSFLN